MKLLNYFAYVFWAVVAVAAFAVTGPAKAEPLKIGFVYVGPIGDYGWTHSHDLGRLAIEKALGDKVKTSFVEKVPEGADAYSRSSKKHCPNCV